MSFAKAWTSARQTLARWRRLANSPPPDEAVFLQRVRFVERGVALPVKAVMLLLLVYFLFFAHWFVNLTPPREDALNGLRNFFLVYLALNVGTGIMLWGMDEISPRLLERAVYSMAILDGAVLAALTLVTGGFDSALYYAFVGLIIRNAAIIPHADVQIVVNLTVSVCYVIAGLLDVALEKMEQQVVRTVGRGGLGEGWSEVPTQISAESLLLRVLLLLLMTLCCYGIQMLIDRQREKEVEEREFALKEHQLAAAGRLAAEIAHQLKNPLGIINNAAYTLQKTVKEGKTITQQISIIREEVDRSDRIITELMGYARLAEGKVERVLITEELDHALALVLPEGAKFEIQVHRDYDLGLLPLLGQRGHFSEIFANLLTNAREAMDGRGELFVSAHAGPDLSVEISIRDTGPGIPADKLKQIFEPYFTTKAKGTGLGLAIVRHNTELYGGAVSVESQLGKGTTFTVKLPIRSLMRLRK
jgi:signal transduction histidine kinase